MRTGSGAKLSSIVLRCSTCSAFHRSNHGSDDLVGQQPVGDHRVDPVAEQREVGVGAPRLGDHHALGVHDEPHARPRGVGEELPHAVEAVVERARRSSNTSSSATGSDVTRDSTGATTLFTRRPTGNSRSMYRDRMSGSDRNRIVSAVGAQSTTTTSHSPDSAKRLDVGEGEDLVEAGDDRELLGLEPVDAGPAEDLAEVALDLVPALLHALLRVELLAPQVVGDRRGQRSERHVEGVGERVGRIGGQHDRAQPGVGAADRGGRGGGGLADAALAGEEEDPASPGFHVRSQLAERGVDDLLLGPPLHEARAAG